MIYEVRTYTLKPGAVPAFEQNFANALPHRLQYSPLAAFWHTEIGPLNQVIHVWPYESLDERARIRAAAAQDPHWPPQNDPETYLKMESEIFIPAPFMRPLGPDQALGSIYEMRSYTYRTGAMPQVIQLWQNAIPHREEHSPLAAAWHTELGGLNKWVHIWPYQNLEERNRIRQEAAQSPHWPPPTREFLVSQENKIMVPAPFSPTH